ncbi:tetratricopeptide repeat protein, partial [Myxococcota bacterium]
NRALEDLQWVWTEARKAGEPLLSPDELIETRVSVARLLRRAGRPDDAANIFKETKDWLAGLAEENPRLDLALRRIGLETARSLIQAGDGVQAAAVLKETLQGLDLDGPEAKRLAAHANKWQAWIEHQAKRYQEALRLYRNGISLVEHLGPSLELASLLDGMAMCLSRSEQFDEAEQALNRALESARDVGNRETQAGVQANLGVLRYRQTRLDESLEHMRKARQAYESIGNDVLAAACRSNMGDILLEQGKADEARAELEAVLPAFRRTRSHDYLIAALQSLLKCLNTLGDKEALEQREAELRALSG